jgi:tRNA (guanine37-N1)-methyltransferase
MELLAGEPCFNVTVVEGGISLQFDARHVYWSSRLAGERARMMQEEILPRQVIADAFCGVGALCIAAAKKKGCTIWANDLNPYAVECCRINAIRNGLKRVTDSGAGAGKGHTTTSSFTVVCEDAKDFIRSLGYRREWENGRDHNSEEVTQNIKVHSTTLLSKKQRSASSQPMDLPHHLIMNYPLDAPAFLDQLRWWPSTSQVETTVHIYTFARADPSTGRDAETVAIDCIAQSLLPQGGAVEMTHNRQSELDALGCNVRAREIRDVAPQKMVIYVAFQATRLLIKRMQGNFGG